MTKTNTAAAASATSTRRRYEAMVARKVRSRSAWTSICNRLYAACTSDLSFEMQHALLDRSDDAWYRSAR